MNDGHPLNNSESQNDFPLVRRSSSAVEKAGPGAKRILSGMVADTLALVRKEQVVLPVVSVAMCGYVHDMYDWFQEIIGLLLKRDLATKSSLEIKKLRLDDRLNRGSSNVAI